MFYLDKRPHTPLQWISGDSLTNEASRLLTPPLLHQYFICPQWTINPSLAEHSSRRSTPQPKNYLIRRNICFYIFRHLEASIKFTLYSSAVKSAAFGGNGAKGSNLLQKWIELFLCKISFPAVDLKLFIKFIMRGTQYYNSIVWAYMTLLVIMMKYEKTVNKRYGRLVLILIDQW